MPLTKCPECSHDVSDQAPTCPSCGYPFKERVHEPEFRAYRKRVFIGTFILCLIGLPVGIALEHPYVIVLSIAGIIATAIGLTRATRATHRS